MSGQIKQGDEMEKRYSIQEITDLLETVENKEMSVKELLTLFSNLYYDVKNKELSRNKLCQIIERITIIR